MLFPFLIIVLLKKAKEENAWTCKQHASHKLAFLSVYTLYSSWADVAKKVFSGRRIYVGFFEDTINYKSKDSGIKFFRTADKAEVIKAATLVTALLLITMHV
jgi:hypothetical protein